MGDDVQVAALIVPQANLNLSAEKLKTLMQQKIELINSSNVAYKEIKKWRLVAGLPKNTVGKIKRNQNVV